MSLNVLTQGGGTGGESASIFITGLSEADSIKATQKIPVKIPVELPDGYTQLEYIESTGTQYLDTGVVRDSDKYKRYTEFQLTSIVTGQIIVGSGVVSSANDYLQVYRDRLIAHWANDDRPLMDAVDTNKHTVEQSWDNGTGIVIFDGASLKQSYAYVAQTGSEYLFAGNSGSDAIQFSFAKINRHKLWKNEELIRDFIPAKRNSDSAVGMYDIANDVFYTNSGTGTFVAGGEYTHYVDGYVDGKTVNGKWVQKPNSDCANLPDGYTQLEYIESTGTQHIETGVYNQSCHGIVLDCQILKFEANAWVAGIWDDMSFHIGMPNDGGQNFFVSVSGDGTSNLTVPFDTNRHTIGFKGTSYIFDEMVSSAPAYSEVTYNKEIPLFGRRTRNHDSLYAATSVRMFGAKMYDVDEVLIRDYIPCRRNSDSVVGMYDLANGVFYTNAGTGAFIAGEELFGHIIDKIKSYGMWTITATNGEKTEVQNVLVDAALEYEIEMSYKLWLYRAGDECEDVTGGWSSPSLKSGYYFDCKNTSEATRTAVKNSDNLQIRTALVANSGSAFAAASFWTVKQIDLTKISTVKFEVYVTDSACGLCIRDVSPLTTTINVNAASSKATTATIVGEKVVESIDVRDLSGMYSIGISVGSYTTGQISHGGKVYKIWLE